MPAPVRTARLLTTLVAAVVLAGCGGDEDGTSCDVETCTVRSAGPGTYELDQLGTEIEVSDLREGAVRVRINSEARTVRRGAPAERIRGFLVTAEETSADRVRLRVER